MKGSDGSFGDVKFSLKHKTVPWNFLIETLQEATSYDTSDTSPTLPVPTSKITFRGGVYLSVRDRHGRVLLCRWRWWRRHTHRSHLYARGKAGGGQSPPPKSNQLNYSGIIVCTTRRGSPGPDFQAGLAKEGKWGWIWMHDSDRIGYWNSGICGGDRKKVTLHRHNADVGSKFRWQ